MKDFIFSACVVLFCTLTVRAADPAIALYESLSPEQRKQATLPADDKEIHSEVFTGGKRPGLQIRALEEKQQKLAIDMLTSFTSSYGREKAEQISNQTRNDPSVHAGLTRYYVTFFGEPAERKSYAWRIAEHHLTIVQVQVEKGEPKSFGPILLGADPPTLWDDEENKMIALYATMTESEKAKATRQGQGISTAEFKGTGIKIGDLNPSAKSAAKAVLDNRLSFFSEPVQARVKKLIDAQGGVDAMQIEFFGAAEKKSRDGGKWDFKLAGPAFLCDYENTRGHIHMCMKGQLKE